MIRWVFLDIGGVILDEDVLAYHVFRRHAEVIRRAHPEKNLQELILERESLTRAGSLWPLFELTSRYLDEACVSRVWDEVDREVRSRYGDFLPPIDRAADAIESL